MDGEAKDTQKRSMRSGQLKNTAGDGEDTSPISQNAGRGVLSRMFNRFRPSSISKLIGKKPPKEIAKFRQSKTRFEPQAEANSTYPPHSDSTTAAAGILVQKVTQDLFSSNIASRNEITQVNETDIQEARDAVLSMRSPSGAVSKLTSVIDEAVSADDKITSAANTFGPLLQKIEVFQSVVATISEVHPYVKMALNVLSAVSVIIIGQMKLDQGILRLLGIMNRTYAFVDDSKALKEIQSHNRVLNGLAQQTLECAYFIRDYSKVESFWHRLKDNFLSDVDATIKAYESSFDNLMAEFRDRAALNTEIIVRKTHITVIRILDDIQGLSTTFDLESMAYAAGASYNTDKQCLAGTRTEVLEEISEWINSTDSSAARIFWLCGPVGTGKSAIAHTIARQFDDIWRLGSCFCFEGADPSERRHNKVFITIARDLAARDVRIAGALADAIRDRGHLKSTQDIKQQWEHLIFHPATKLSAAMVGPLVIVIDALDQSGDAESRRVLLSVLAEHAAELPANFRILVTSRPAPDIKRAFISKAHIRVKEMDTIPLLSTNQDISSYISQRLAGIDDMFFDSDKLRLLVERAAGIFRRAHLATSYISTDDAMQGLSIQERVSDILSSDPEMESTWCSDYTRWQTAR